MYKKVKVAQPRPTYEKTAQLLVLCPQTPVFRGGGFAYLTPPPGALPLDPAGGLLLGYSPPNFNFWRCHCLFLVSRFNFLSLFRVAD